MEANGSHGAEGEGIPARTDEAASFDEPAGLSVAGNTIYVADTNHHLIKRST